MREVRHAPLQCRIVQHRGDIRGETSMQSLLRLQLIVKASSSLLIQLSSARLRLLAKLAAPRRFLQRFHLRRQRGNLQLQLSNGPAQRTREPGVWRLQATVPNDARRFGAERWFAPRQQSFAVARPGVRTADRQLAALVSIRLPRAAASIPPARMPASSEGALPALVRILQ